MVIVKLYDPMALDGKTYAKGVYEVVEGREAKAGELSRAQADQLKEAYPDSVKEFKDGERIEDLAAWKRGNTVVLTSQNEYTRDSWTKWPACPRYLTRVEAKHPEGCQMPSLNLYCTATELKARLDIGDTDDDASLESVITAASRFIDSKTGRRFYTTTETRVYSTYLDWLVEIDDLVTLTSLKTDPAGDGTYTYLWAAADYRLFPYNAALYGEPYTAIEVAYGGAYRFPVALLSRPRIQVIGAFGYSATVPPTIKEACILASMRMWSRKDLIFGISGSAEMGTLQAITSLGSDGELRALLGTVKRKAIV